VEFALTAVLADGKKKKSTLKNERQFCFVENFSLTPGFSRVRMVCAEKKPFKRFFLGAFVVHRVKTRC
jgi:hypothetical protein